ncbi:hypothetical protein XENTR_v10002973 [Xenopus tropicalis]|nr:hypothetical protein XENTR_v10002973 [Xenopus tropicalis]
MCILIYTALGEVNQSEVVGDMIRITGVDHELQMVKWPMISDGTLGRFFSCRESFNATPARTQFPLWVIVSNNQ